MCNAESYENAQVQTSKFETRTVAVVACMVGPILDWQEIWVETEGRSPLIEIESH